MRRSLKHGWVAKAYPQLQSSSSQQDLDQEEFTEGVDSAESFDSFFDDEFEEEGETEKLGNLLACNTLGVEKKVTVITAIVTLHIMKSSVFLHAGHETRLDLGGDRDPPVPLPQVQGPLVRTHFCTLRRGTCKIDQRRIVAYWE